MPMARPSLLNAIQRRCLSTRRTIPPPTSKIRCVPFAISPEQALEALQKQAEQFNVCRSPRTVGLLNGLFGEAGDRFSRRVGMHTKMTIKNMRAIYYPAWFGLLHLEGKVQVDKNVKDGYKLAQYLTLPYIPGNAELPLANVSLHKAIGLDTMFKPWDPKTQLQELGRDVEVIALPYTVSPLDLLELIHKKLGSGEIKYDGLSFDMATWHARVCVFAPIMCPMYIGDIEEDTPTGQRISSTAYLTATLPSADANQVGYTPKSAPIEIAPHNQSPDWLPGLFCAPKRNFTKMEIGPERGQSNRIAHALARYMVPELEGPSRSLVPSPLKLVEKLEGGVVSADRRIQPADAWWDKEIIVPYTQAVRGLYFSQQKSYMDPTLGRPRGWDVARAERALRNNTPSCFQGTGFNWHLDSERAVQNSKKPTTAPAMIRKVSAVPPKNGKITPRKK